MTLPENILDLAKRFNGVRLSTLYSGTDYTTEQIDRAVKSLKAQGIIEEVTTENQIIYRLK